jgi:hypothetical protein
VKIEDEDGGHDNGGKERICPFGRPDMAIEMPAMWYLRDDVSIRQEGRIGAEFTEEIRETSSQLQTLEINGTSEL